MLKQVVIATVLLCGSYGLCAAADMTVPGNTVGGDASSVEADIIARDDPLAGGGMHGAPVGVSTPAPEHVQPDSTASEAHADGHAAAGTDTGWGEGSHKGHHRWQSLLPGVMK